MRMSESSPQQAHLLYDYNLYLQSGECGTAREMPRQREHKDTEYDEKAKNIL